MQSLFAKLKTPVWYFNFCLLVAFLGWLPFFLATPMIHGGSIASYSISWAGLILGGYCSLELFRSSSSFLAKSFAIVGFIIYGSAVTVGLYFAIPHISAAFAT